MKEYRRIQKTGESTYIISLPKKWADANNIERGTEASMQVNEDGSLTLTVKKEKKDSTAVIHSNNNIERTLQKVIAAYLAGHQKIIIRGTNAAIICEEARTKLSGIEVLEETEDQGILGVLSHDNKFTIDEILVRMHSVSLTLFTLFIRSLNGEKDLQKEAARREQEIDRLYILGLRVINTRPTKLAVGVCKALAIKTMERISDHIEQPYAIAAYPTKDKQLLELVNELKELYVEVFNNLVNLSNSDSTLTRIDNYRNKIQEINKKSPDKKFIVERLMRIDEYLIDIIEITEDLIAIRNANI
ncbi:MAG: phosphate uptake regulator PhoU [Candidatus Micrarchaeota archaeon]|nr:phosphate uptake regulator PhoU [Candidatus Micrarchaeota archaeon]